MTIADTRELSGSEERAHLILESDAEGVLGVDTQGRINFVNPAACRLLGFTIEEMIGRPSHDLVHYRRPDGSDYPIEQYPIFAAYRRGESSWIDNEFLWRKDGTGLSVEYRAAPVYKAGVIVGAVVSFSDTTDRKQAERELRQASFLATMALELTGSGYWHVDYSDPDYYYQSELAARIVGEEIKADGRYHLQDEWFSRLIEADPELAQQTNDLYQGAIDGRYKNYDAIYAYKRPVDGRIVWLHASGSVVRGEDGKALHMYGVYQDITEAKKAEQEIKASEQRVRETEQFFRSVLELAPDGLMVVDDTGVIELVNAQCEKLFGCPRDKLIGQSLEDIVPAGDRPWHLTLKEVFYRKPVTREMGASRNLCALHKDGSLLPVEIGLSPLPARNSTGAKVAVSILDISQRKQHENALEQARAKAEEATEMKSIFLANMSHEMRTPMNAIIGLAHLVLKTQLTQKQQDYIGKVHNAGRSLLAVINDILDFSKIEAGKLDIEEIEFALDDVIASVTTLTGEKAHDKGLEFLADVPPSVPMHLVGDPQRLGQILTNLVNNAIKFTERGEVRLKTECIARNGENVELCFSVRDTGIGMSPEQVSRLFQPFTQADMSTTRKHGGTGLGLTISRKLVEMMGGRIWLESQAAVGSTFFFTIPLGIGSEAGSERIVPAQLRKLNVLIVDDNSAAREILVNALYDVTANNDAVESGSEALAAVVRHDGHSPYDVIFMDWQMPDIDGLEATRQIKQDTAITKQPRVVLVTAFGREEVREEAERLKIDGFLMKPVTRSMLVDALVTIFAPDAQEISRAVAESDSDRLRGVRILLAEDNEINQQIAVELLEAVGASVDVANDGREAVEMLMATGSEQRYNVVLSDLQMPVIDGYQFSAQIRADARFDRLPIIAMTAHATVEERQRCFAAGMNDHISKPIDAEVLFETVGRHCRPPRGAPIASVIASSPFAVEHLPAIEGLDAVTGLRRVAGNRKLYLKLLQQFVAQHVDTVTQLAAQLDAGDHATAKRTAHTVKGTAGNLGARRVENAAADLEAAINEHSDAARLETWRCAFSEALSRLLAHLSLALGTQRTAVANSTKAIEPAQVQPIVAHMLQQLWECDTAAADTLDLQGAELSSLFAPADFERFEKKVRDYAFGDAQTLLEQAAKAGGIVL
jgi:PAS domain S-box-containing protein